MKWLGRLVLALIVLAALAWGGVVLMVPGQIARVLEAEFGDRLTATDISASLTGQVALSGVTLRQPGTPEAVLERLALRPVWQGGPALGFEGDAVVLDGGVALARVEGHWTPDRSRRGPFEVTVTDLAMPQATVGRARLTGLLDLPAEAMADLRLTAEAVKIDGEAPEGALTLAIADLTVETAAVSAAALAPTTITAGGVTGEVLQGAAKLFIAGVQDATVTAEIDAVALDAPEIALPVRLTADAASTPPLTAEAETLTVLRLDRPQGCAGLDCARGLADLGTEITWQVRVGEEAGAGGFSCATMPCLPEYQRLRVSDAQGFTLGLAATRTLSPLLMGFILSELQKAAPL